MSDIAHDVPKLRELMGKVSLHEHLCLIYSTQQEQFSATIPFLKVGLERGEKCIYIADTNTTTAVSNGLRAEGIDVDAAIRRGSLTITGREIYPETANFDPDRMIEFLGEAVNATKSAGYSALRVTDEMTWVTRIDPRPERLIEYEAKVNHFLHDYDILGICQYDRRLFPPEVLLEIIRTHPTVVYDGRVCENPYFVPPDEFLNPRRAEREIERMLARMRGDTERNEQLRENEADLAEAQRVAKLGSWKFNLADGSVTWSEEVYRIFEVDKAVFGGNYESFLNNVHPEDRVRVLQTNRVARETGGPFEIEYRIVTSAGAVKNVREVGYVKKDDNGSVLRLFGTVQDITDYRRAQEELQKLSGRLLQLQDEERSRIARELHDTTGQNLVVLATTLSLLRELMPKSDRKFRRRLSESKTLAEKCIQEIRTLSYVLHPPVLEHSGLQDAILDYVKGFTERSGIEVLLDCSPRLGRFARDVELTVFRLIQESLSNTQRHSGSKHARVSIDRNSDLTLEISDAGREGSRNGAGEATLVSQFKPGVGILSMQERVKSIGGRLQVQSTNRGTTVRAVIPLGEEGEKTALLAV